MILYSIRCYLEYTPFNLSNADLYMIILPSAEFFIYKRYFIGYKVTVT